MLRVASIRPDYSRAERISDAAVHLVALGLAVGFVPVLIVWAVHWRGDGAAIAGAAVYGGTLIAMIVCSLLYNAGLWPARRALFRRLDHSAIYLKIAGTFTPFALVSGGGPGFLATLWGVALAGAGLKLADPGRFRWLGLALYLGLGWLGAAAGWQMFAGLPPAAFWLVVAGGLTYTGGVAFYLAEGRMFHNTLWHVCVMAASAAFFVAVALTMAAV